MNIQKLGQKMTENGAVHVVSTIIWNLMSSAAEDVIVALYLNLKYGVTIRNTLEEMGHPHPTMPLHTKNSTQEGISNRTIVSKLPKAVDIHFYWLRDRDHPPTQTKFIGNPHHKI